MVNETMTKQITLRMELFKFFDKIWQSFW